MSSITISKHPNLEWNEFAGCAFPTGLTDVEFCGFCLEKTLNADRHHFRYFLCVAEVIAKSDKPSTDKYGKIISTALKRLSQYTITHETTDKFMPVDALRTIREGLSALRPIPQHHAPLPPVQPVIIQEPQRLAPLPAVLPDEMEEPLPELIDDDQPPRQEPAPNNPPQEPAPIQTRLSQYWNDSLLFKLACFLTLGLLPLIVYLRDCCDPNL